MTDHATDNDASVLHRLRNMWQFANLCQWIYIFGKAAKIDEAMEIEDLEMECLKPQSSQLPDIALSILKLVSHHKGLNLDILDDQLRKQYILHLPEDNPFGDADDDGPTHSFADMDVFKKIIVLQQLTQWAMEYPDRLREKMDEHRDQDQATWRIEPYGWDADDRTYFVLDDNRVYRMSEAPEPPKAAKPKSKKRKPYSGGKRSSKRRRTLQAEEEAKDESENEDGYNHAEKPEEPRDMSLGGMVWECVAITLADVQGLIDSFKKSRDANEKVLRQQLADHLLPILEKQEESRKRKEQQRERELLNLAKMVNAKRSSRLANKAEVKKEEEHKREEEIKAKTEEIERKREEAQQRKLEKERDARLYARERRLKERDARRRLHQEELAQLSEDSKGAPDNSRISERRIHAEIEKNKQALKELEEDDDDWTFDCICGLYGQVDDGAHSVACERCNVWQHSKCIGVTAEEAEKPEFHFICSSCRHRLETPRKTIKIKVKSSASKTDDSPNTTLNSVEKQNGPEQPVQMSPSIRKSSPTPVAPKPAPSVPEQKPFIPQPAAPVQHTKPQPQTDRQAPLPAPLPAPVSIPSAPRPVVPSVAAPVPQPPAVSHAAPTVTVTPKREPTVHSSPISISAITNPISSVPSSNVPPARPVEVPPNISPPRQAPTYTPHAPINGAPAGKNVISQILHPAPAPAMPVAPQPVSAPIARHTLPAQPAPAQQQHAHSPQQQPQLPARPAEHIISPRQAPYPASAPAPGTANSHPFASSPSKQATLPPITSLPLPGAPPPHPPAANANQTSPVRPFEAPPAAAGVAPVTLPRPQAYPPSTNAPQEPPRHTTQY